MFMKAVSLTKYGQASDALQYTESAPRPTAAAGRVVVAVCAASANSADWHLMSGDPWLLRLGMGLFKPSTKITGADFAGVVTEVGPDVKTGVKVGDEVFGDASGSGFGAFAQFVSVKAEHVAAKPANLGFEESAALPMAAMTALQAVDSVAKVRPGQRVCVFGATGGVGHFAAQVAKARGAHVTVVGASTKEPMLRALGADEVLLYDRVDVASLAPGAAPFDVVFDAAAYRSPFAFKNILAAGGHYVLIGGTMSAIMKVALVGGIVSRWHGRKHRYSQFLSLPTPSALATVKAMAEAGQLKPSISHRFPLLRGADAIQALADRIVQGKAVVQIPARTDASS